MTMFSSRHIHFAAVLFLAALVPLAHADTICASGTCTVTIAQDSGAAIGNFQSPGATATVGYTIDTNDDGTNFNVVLSSADPSASLFANLYFDTIASTPNTGSNLGFEFGQNSGDAFIPGVPGSNVSFTVPGGGFTSVFTVIGGVTTAAITIPNTFFLNNPLGMAFTTTPSGTLVSLHLSQSFGLSVVGGGTLFPPPVELGDAIVSTDSSVPEPASFLLLGIGLLGMAGIGVRKIGLA